jgi:Cu(I)/Ag(I) efflux system membrane fusion protein
MEEQKAPVQAAKFHCPMHPAVVSDKAGDCPICGMKLVPMEVTTVPSGSNSPSGLAAVSITPAARERMGLRLGTVEKRTLAREIRTSARIVADETRLHHVTVKIDGYVEKLFTATVGQYVKQGEPLLTIYSPALVSAQQEYLNVLNGNAGLAAAASKRLSLWDITDEQIERLAKTRQPERTVTLFAPATGWIIERDISAGHRVMAGEQLMVLADLSNVWADSDIYQSDLPHVKLGMPVELDVSAVPDMTFTGKVSFIAPALDAGTRTVKVRMEVPNAALLLKPEMYAVARLAFDLGERLAIPETAVMRTGVRSYAFRDAGEGRLEPTEIKLGTRTDGWFELTDGLKEGDKVVTSANFLVDSESSMKAAIEALSGK